MKLHLVKVGKPAFSEVSKLVDEYLKRSKIWIEVAHTVTRKVEQDKNLIKKASTPTKWIIFDEIGKSFSSTELAAYIDLQSTHTPTKEIIFVIGGPYGVPEEYKKKADLTLSLGKVTLPSDLAWLIVSEQIYRALSINKGSSYHHGSSGSPE